MEADMMQGKSENKVPAGAWRGYELDVGQARARDLFMRRYGYRPARVIVSGPLLLAGPIREREVRDGQ